MCDTKEIRVEWFECRLGFNSPEWTMMQCSCPGNPFLQGPRMIQLHIWARSKHIAVTLFSEIDIATNTYFWPASWLQIPRFPWVRYTAWYSRAFSRGHFYISLHPKLSSMLSPCPLQHCSCPCSKWAPAPVQQRDWAACRQMPSFRWLLRSWWLPRCQAFSLLMRFSLGPTLWRPSCQVTTLFHFVG